MTLCPLCFSTWLVPLSPTYSSLCKSGISSGPSHRIESAGWFSRLKQCIYSNTSAPLSPLILSSTICHGSLVFLLHLVWATVFSKLPQVIQNCISNISWSRCHGFKFCVLGECSKFMLHSLGPLSSASRLRHAFPAPADTCQPDSSASVYHSFPSFASLEPLQSGCARI